MNDRRKKRTLQGHYVEALRQRYPNASHQGADPLTTQLADDQVSAAEYEAALAGAGSSARAQALLRWVEARVDLASRDAAIDTLWWRFNSVNREIGDLSTREYAPDDRATVDRLMALNTEHLELAAVLNQVMPGRDERMGRLGQIELNVDTREKRDFRAQLRRERWGFAEVVARHLEAFLDHDATAEDEDAYQRALSLWAGGEVGPGLVDTFIGGWENAILSIAERGEVALLRALLHLPALIAYARQAGLHAVSDEPALTLAPLVDEEGETADPWERFSDPSVGATRTGGSEHLWARVDRVLTEMPAGRLRQDFEAWLNGEREVDIAARTGRSRQAVSNNIHKAIERVRASD